MKSQSLLSLFLVFLTGFLPLLAQAHSGHGQTMDSHWHSTDIWGFLALWVVLVLGVYFNKKK